MSSLFDVPVQLALLLSLAASAAGPDTSTPGAGPELTLSSQQTTAVVQPLAGPFGFSESLWLRAIKEGVPYGASRGYAGRIFKTSGGRFYVPAATERDEILDARWDVSVASRVARAFAELNASRMRRAIGRAPTSGDLYLAHLFGPEAAVSLIKLAENRPNSLAPAHFPELLEAAPEALFDQGKPITVGQLYERITRSLRERSAPSQVTMARANSDGATLAGFSFKPTLASPEHEQGELRPLAFAWRGEVIGVDSAVPLQ